MDEILKIIHTELEANELSLNMGIADKPVRSQDPNPAKLQSGTTRAFVATNENRDSTIKCYFCKGNHYAFKCEQVTSVAERRKILLKSKRCFICLKIGHVSRDCTNNSGCRKCNGKHHRAICFGEVNKESTQSTTANDSATGSSITASAKGKGNVLLQTATAFVYGHEKERKEKVNILFDLGSQRSYITEDLKKRLQLDAENSRNLHLNTFGTDKYRNVKCCKVHLFVEVLGSSDVEISAFTQAVICSPLQSRVDIRDYPHLRGIQLANRSNDEFIHIDILIGADKYYEFVDGDVLKCSGSGITATSSKLGWLLSGPVNCISDSETDCTDVVSHLVIDRKGTFMPTDFAIDAAQKGQDRDTTEIVDALSQFWKNEACGLHETGIVEDIEEKPRGNLDIAFNGNRYEVSLPWKCHWVDNLSNDYDLCLGRLKSVFHRLKQRPSLLEEYNGILQEQLKQGFIERVDNHSVSNQKCHFISHHYVIREDKATTKVRVVFDGSAKCNVGSRSLNDLLEVGDNFVPPLFETLLRFRLNPVALTADIEKAFLQIEIKEADRNALRFLWYEDVHEAEPRVVQYRFNRLPFGLTCSPGILGATIRHHLSSFQVGNPDAVEVLSRLYADDLSCGAKNTEQAFALYRDCKEIMRQGGFNLRKWNSNDQCLLRRINEAEGNEQQAHPPDSKVTLCNEVSSAGGHAGLPANEVNKVLGVVWHTAEDLLSLDLRSVLEYARTLQPTKRSLLKIAAKIFDPLGCLIPRLHCYGSLLDPYQK